MKDRLLIIHGSPCVVRLGDPTVQSYEASQAGGLNSCPFYPERRDCSAPGVACAYLAGAAIARNVLQFYDEASEETLAMEQEEFRRRAPLPPDKIEAYVEPQGDELRRITDPEEAVQRVGEYARAVLDLKPGERISRNAEKNWAPPQEAEAEEAGASGSSVA